MIKEAYCSKEVSELLKEKGFNEDCYTYYDDIDDSINRFDKGLHFNNTSYPWGVPYDVKKAKKYIVAPTHQMAMKWLREVHSLCISIYYLWPCGYEIDIYRIGKDTPISEFEAIREYGYDTYEEAVETALKYCLENLI